MSTKMFLLFLAGFVSGIRGREFGIFSPENISKWAAKHADCQKDLEKVVQGLMAGETWALTMLDASTKIPAGIITGHFVDYGNFDECLEIRENVSAQYCIATISLSSDLMNRFIGNISSLMPSMPLRWSYCIPASCPPECLENAFREVLKNHDVNITVRSSDCQSNDRIPLTGRDLVGISIWGTFIGLAILSTIYDVICTKRNVETNCWLIAFSFYMNGIKLLSTKVKTDTMRPLHGIKFLSICWVILGHRYFFTISSSLLNLIELTNEMRKLQSQFFIQGVLAVDTFFLISGLLNCYNVMKILDKTNRFPVCRYYIHRYIRLTPSLAAIVLMYATWYALIGDGPAWSQTTSQWKQLCVDNWWPTLLYINNYYNPVSQCAGQSWYLAVDMQLYWLSPMVVVPLWYFPQYGRVVLWCLLVLSAISQFVIAYLYKFRMPLTIGLNLAELENVTKMIYVPTHTRATPYIIGIILGDYLHSLKKSNTPLILSKGFVRIGWFITTMVCLSVVFGNFQFSRPIEDHPYNVWESSLYTAFHRTAWGGGIAWIIFCCLNKQGGFINVFLSWKLFIPLSKLTYSIFLCHMAIQQFQVGTARTSDYFQHFNQIHRFFGDIFFSIIAAAGLSLLFESPVLVLEKLAGKKPRRRSLKSEDNQGFQADSSTTNS